MTFKGSGSFGSVKKAIRNSDGKEVAIKIIPKRNVKNHYDMVKDEVNVLKGLNHPNVIGFYDYFESRYILTNIQSALIDKYLYKGTNFILYLNCMRYDFFFSLKHDMTNLLI